MKKLGPSFYHLKSYDFTGLEALRSICNTYRDIKTIEAKTSAEKFYIRKQAEVAIEQYRQETKRIMDKNERDHIERMEVIAMVRDLVNKDIVDADLIKELTREVLAAQRGGF